VQREENEVRRTLAHLPAGLSRPSATQLRQLRLGEFYVVHGGACTKTYVQPAWMPAETARRIACGGSSTMKDEATVTLDEANDLRAENARLREVNRRLREELIAIENDRRAPPVPPPPPAPVAPPSRPVLTHVEGASLTGQLATLVAQGFFDRGGKRIDDAVRELERRHAGPEADYAMVHAALEELAAAGFVARQGHHYARRAEAVIRVQPPAA
jgi:hypothetical protein